MYDYDSLAAFRIQRQSLELDCEREMKRFHKIFYDGNVPVDVIPAGNDLLGYRVVIDVYKRQVCNEKFCKQRNGTAVRRIYV